MSLSLKPLTTTRFVVEVEDLDLSQPVDGTTVAALRKEINEHSILVFRGQTIDNDQHVAFTRNFGDLEIHTVKQYLLPDYPEIIALANRGEKGTTPIDNGGAYWHTDISYKVKPPMGSLLYSLEVPPEGGDTMFADMYSAYDALNDDMKNQIDSLRAVHGYEARFTKMGQENKRPKLSEKQLAEVPEVSHPVVRINPETGRKALYVNEGFTLSIEGLPMDEGRELLDSLNAHAMKPEFVYSHNWRVGDLVFWDNRAVMHCATAYDTSYARTMHRTTVQGDIPI
jgi:taurine dioxygenase